jgi:phage terminase Nu1 subunit (DNA packaging protein)
MFYWIKRSEAELNSNDNSLSAQTIDEILKYYRLSYEEAKAARAQEEQEALKRLSKEESAQLRTLKTEFTIFNDKSILHNLLNTLHSL